MSELDLIPGEYRVWVWQLRWIRRWAWMIGGIVLLTLSVNLLLQQSNRRIANEVLALEQRKNISLVQRQEIQRLQSEREETLRRLHVLESIRESDPTLATLQTVDRAIDGKSVWFQQWGFEKGSPLADGQGPAPRMSLKGQALDNSALSGFVEALLTEPLVENAQITRSALRRYVSSSVVDFEVTVNLRRPAPESH